MASLESWNVTQFVLEAELNCLNVGMTFAKVLADVIGPLGPIVMKDLTAKSGLEMAAAAPEPAV